MTADRAELRALLTNLRLHDQSGPTQAVQVGDGVMVVAEVAGYALHLASCGAADSPASWACARFLAAAVNALPELLDAADERDRLADLAEGKVAEHFINNTLFKGMTAREDGLHLEMQPAREVVALWAATCRGILTESGAKNYAETRVDLPPDVDEGLVDDREGIELTVKRGVEYDRFVVRIGRAGKVTPHEARVAAEKKRDEALDQRDSARATAVALEQQNAVLLETADEVTRKRADAARATGPDPWAENEQLRAQLLAVRRDHRSVLHVDTVKAIDAVLARVDPLRAEDGGESDG